MRTDTGTTIRLTDYAPTPYAAPDITMMFALHPKATVVRTTTTFEPRGEAAGPLTLDGDGLTLTEALLDGVSLTDTDIEATPDSFTLKTPPQRRFTLTLTTVLAPDDNTELMGLYRSNGIYCTQCEAEGFRRITYAYDRPDVLSVYDVWIVGDSTDDVPLLANGNLISRGTSEGRPTAHWHDPHPKPPYLFALVAGPLDALNDTFETASGRSVDLAIYVEPGKTPRATYAMDALKRSMRWDETRFGREYDLDVFNIVAVSDFNMGAMENKGLNVFNDAYVLADPRLATDSDYNGIEAVIAHEYFHNWTGNRITCRDWFQLCLKEGFTVFRDQEFTADVRSRGVKRVEDARRLRLAQFREDASPLRHPVRPQKYAEISNLYTATVYEKGAELVRMVKTIVGDEAFAAGCTHYFDTHDGTAATVEDFLKSFKTLDHAAFMPWYNEPGTPTVRVDEVFEDGTYIATLTQVPADGASPKPIPLRTALFINGKEAPLPSVTGATTNGDCITLGADTATLTLEVDKAPTLSVLRGFSAPVLIERPRDEARDIALIALESDPFSVWDATQRVLTATMRDAYDGTPLATDALSDALHTAITNTALEPALRALLLTLPTRGELVRAVGSDVDAARIVTAHTKVRDALAKSLAATLLTLSEADRPAPDDVSAKAAGARALNTVAERYAVTQTVIDRARSAPNMTERLAALTTLIAHSAPETDDALASFETAFSTEPLVMDKYFALQAARDDGAPLVRVKALMAHPGFSLKNPNRTRALIGAFTANIAAFHAADGSGYRFIGEIIAHLDGENPQLAARLATTFGEARRYDAPRREAADATLKSLAESAKSSDVADIVRRLRGA
ncbi:MAG: aminopeptidase N [Pseudomonadota bacterium]